MPAQVPWILGIAASHNGAACLLHGEEIVAAVQEERLVHAKRALTRGACSPLSVRYCLDYAGIRPEELSAVVLCAAQSNKSKYNDVSLDPYLRVREHGVPVFTIPHHLGHAVGAFATSGFSEAAVMVIDGMGSPQEELTPDEQRAIIGSPNQGHETISLYVASATSVRPIEKHLVDYGAWLERRLPHGGMRRFGSLGGMYSAVGEQIFGDPLDGAGKVMGLAPFGTATLAPADFFSVSDGIFRFSDTVPRMFEHGQRWPSRQQEYSDLAASVQRALEEAVLYLAARLRSASGSANLCYAGGVALNSVANERIVRESGFDNVFIMPAAEDSGTAIGAAYFGLWQVRSTRALPLRKRPDSLGKHYSPADIESAIERTPAVCAHRSQQSAEEAVRLLMEGRIVGWFHAGSELGPRALGQRSILADARVVDMKDRLNRSVKGRESFRPFAPVVLQEDVAAWFDVERSFESPYMLRVCRFREDVKQRVPAVVHVDGSGRVQTVDREANPQLHALLQEFKSHTDVPLLLNTSFNIAGDPIVETPHDALWTLLNCGLDAVVLGDYVVTKAPGYRSILDLHVELCAESFTTHESPRQPDADPYLELPCAFSEAAREWMLGGLYAAGVSYALFRVTTPFGGAMHAFPAAVARVARLLDGRVKGREIAERLTLEAGSAVDAEWVRSTLRAFGARGIARFSA